MNTYLVSGTLARDAAFLVRSGLSICRLQVRVMRQHKRDGVLQQTPFELEVSAFGRSAERARDLRCGTRLTVRGRLDPYEARDGKLRLGLLADELEWERYA